MLNETLSIVTHTRQIRPSTLLRASVVVEKISARAILLHGFGNVLQYMLKL